MRPYVVITLVENGFTIAVNGVPLPTIYVAVSAEQVVERVGQILEQLLVDEYGPNRESPQQKESHA